MNWIKLDTDIFSHPKVIKLERLLGQHASVYLIRLWAWASKYAPSGDLSGHESLDLAIAAGWEEEPDHFVSALVRCRLIDDHDGLRLHDWDDHQGSLIAMRERARERVRQYRAQHVTRTTREPIENTRAKRRGEEKRGEEKETSAPPPTVAPPATAETPVLTYPTIGTATSWDLLPSVVAELSTAFDGVDVLAEARSALAWIQADPTRRKTPGGMRRYLTAWIQRSVDKGRAARPNNSPALRIVHPPVTGPAADLLQVQRLGFAILSSLPAENDQALAIAEQQLKHAKTAKSAAEVVGLALTHSGSDVASFAEPWDGARAVLMKHLGSET